MKSKSLAVLPAAAALAGSALARGDLGAGVGCASTPRREAGLECAHLRLQLIGDKRNADLLRPGLACGL